jgi:hypothetical protein
MTGKPVNETDLLLTNFLLAALRWSARLLGLAMVGLHVAIFAGAGGFALLRPSPADISQILVFLTSCLGLLVAWRREGLGGMLMLVGLVLFYPDEHQLVSRFPQGWGFPVMAVPAVLFVACGFIQTCRPGLGARSEGGLQR